MSQNNDVAERAGFETTRIANLFKRLHLYQKHCNFKRLDSLDRLLFSHDFLLFYDEI